MDYKDWFKNKYILLAIIACSIFVLDQWTKWLIVQTFHFNEAKVIIPGFFDLTHLRNYGAAWSVLANTNAVWRTPLLLTLSYVTLIIILVYYYFLPNHQRWLQWAFSLVVGGAIGNIVDRHRLNYVVDFLSFHLNNKFYWPAFNVADSCISIGAVMIFISLWFNDHTKTSKPS